MLGFSCAAFRRSIALTIACALTAACATTGANGQMSSLDRSINQCVGSLVVATALGALIGAASHRAGQGAAYGAGAGGLMCAVFMAMNDAQDKERVRQNEMSAASSGRNQTVSYAGSDGQQRVVTTTVQPALIPASAIASSSNATNPAVVGPCRRAQTQITVSGQGSASLDPELVCRTSQGDWVSVNSGTGV